MSPKSKTSSRNRPASRAELVRLPLVYRLPGMEKAGVRTDIVYRKSGNDELKMDVYTPGVAEPAAPRPAVIFIHGGPIPAPPVMPPKDWVIYKDYGKLAAASGFVGVTFNHSYFGIKRIADANSDIVALIEHVRREAPGLGIDGDRLALCAYSGGGSFLSDFLRHPPEYVRALAAFYAIMDLRPYAAHTPAGIDENILARFSPVDALGKAPKNLPPIFIGRAGLDAPMLNAGIDQFVEMALKKNVRLAVRNHPEGFHGFDVLNDDATSRDILREAFAFLKTNLG